MINCFSIFVTVNWYSNHVHNCLYIYTHKYIQNSWWNNGPNPTSSWRLLFLRPRRLRRFLKQCGSSFQDILRSGGFQSHRGYPQIVPFIDGIFHRIFHEINNPFGVHFRKTPIWKWWFRHVSPRKYIDQLGSLSQSWLLKNAMNWRHFWRHISAAYYYFLPDLSKYLFFRKPQALPAEIIMKSNFGQAHTWLPFSWFLIYHTTQNDILGKWMAYGVGFTWVYHGLRNFGP